MDDWFIILGILFYFLFIMYAANHVDLGVWPAGTVRLFLYSLSAFLFLIGPFGMQAITISLQSGNEELRQMIDPLQVGLVSILAIACATFTANLIRAEEVRTWLAQRVKGYNPESTVHLTAVLLVLVVLCLNLFQFVLSGGLDGVAQALEESNTVSFSSVFETVLFVAAAFLGVGYAIRRTMPDALQRLGLRLPIRQDVLSGAILGISLYLLSIVYTLIWAQLVDPQTFAEQTRAAQQLSNQMETIPLIILVAGGAAVGEEVFMRGALQPVFGIWLTSAFFALLHSQYLLTPTIIFIFVIGFAFGQIRWRISTTAAIFAHFVYNIAPFVLLIVLGGTP